MAGFFQNAYLLTSGRGQWCYASAIIEAFLFWLMVLHNMVGGRGMGEQKWPGKFSGLLLNLKTGVRISPFPLK